MESKAASAALRLDRRRPLIVTNAKTKIVEPVMWGWA